MVRPTLEFSAYLLGMEGIFKLFNTKFVCMVGFSGRLMAHPDTTTLWRTAY
jgi:hypothetical protein